MQDENLKKKYISVVGMGLNLKYVSMSMQIY
jgi:hypothetical protein